MAYSFADALDLLDLAIGRASEITEPETLAPYAQTATEIRSRLGFLGRSVVVALVGGTGSGKSSLLNALAGEAVAPTGLLRPTTERPLAWIPANPEPGLVRLLDDLGVQDRVGHSSFGEIAILDLPDTDSVVSGHRDIVERLLPRADAVLWVLDPEKYNDGLLHNEFLKQRSTYSTQFLFALNQIDRLSPPEERQVLDDVHRTLAADGITDVQVVAIAADPIDGTPIGIDSLKRDLAGRFEEKKAVISKVIADLKEVREGIALASGVGLGSGTAYDDRWDEAADAVSSSLVEPMVNGETVAESEGRRQAMRSGGGPVPAVAGWLRSTRFFKAAGLSSPAEVIHSGDGAHVTRATSSLVEFVTELSFETGGSFGRVLREETPPEEIETQIKRVTEAAALEVGEFTISESKSWWKTAGFVQWLLAAVVLGGAIWLWSDSASLRPGGDIRPMLLVYGSLVVGLLLRTLVVVSGKRAGRRALRQHQLDMERAIRTRLDQRVGIPIRTRMRSRAEIAGALAELGIATAALEAQQPMASG